MSASDIGSHVAYILDGVQVFCGALAYVTSDGWIGIECPFTGRVDEARAEFCFVVGR